MKIRRVLCPVDFSDASKQALEYAKGVLEGQSTEVVLLHVVEPYVLPIEYGMSPIPRVELDAAAKKNAEDELAKQGKQYFPKQKVQTLVQFGRASEVILAQAKEKGCDLILLSTHGRTGLSRVFIGSTAERVVRLAPCPVLTVRGT